MDDKSILLHKILLSNKGIKMMDGCYMKDKLLSRISTNPPPNRKLEPRFTLGGGGISVRGEGGDSV